MSAWTKVAFGVLILSFGACDNKLPPVADSGPSKDSQADQRSEDQGVDAKVELCGNGAVDPAEKCDTSIAPGKTGACPDKAACDDKKDCTEDAVLKAGTCEAECENKTLTICKTGDGCCPASCDKTTDDDCAAVCGNGVLEPTEDCDKKITAGQAGACPMSASDCDDKKVCSKDSLLNAGTCKASCKNELIVTCQAGDGCCPIICDQTTDSDCAAVCGNGVLESPGELCDTKITAGQTGACPTSATQCDDTKACTKDAVLDPGTCRARCDNANIVVCASGDGCCPTTVNCNNANDKDCPAVCGNGVLEPPGELCDTTIAVGSAGACPTSCDDGKVCTKDTLTNAGKCDAQCAYAPITACISGDGCCAPGCGATRDSDCAPLAITTGREHSCLVSTSGQVFCWGQNSNGQLGNGTYTASSTPTVIVGVDSGVIDVKAGDNHTCALTKTGAVYCWGYNGQGQLGDNTGSSRNRPTQVSGMASGIYAIGLGALHSCAIDNNGKLRCWGYNNYGQLGTNNKTMYRVPTDVSSLSSGVAQVEGGLYHTCAIHNGAAKCWGRDSRRQLGGATAGDRLVPTAVVGLGVGVTNVAAGNEYSCAIHLGVVKCWGYNGYGQLGSGNYATQAVPTPAVGGLVGNVATRVEAGAINACALTTSKTLYCWGDNTYGQLGDGTRLRNPTPASPLSAVESVAVGTYTVCARTTTGALRCWGDNIRGQVGNGRFGYTGTPGIVAALKGLSVKAIVGGSAHYCALTGTNGVKCWGRGGHGQLGRGVYANSSAPQDVTGLTTGVSKIVAGANFSCAIQNGALKCWGEGSSYQLGHGLRRNESNPVPVTGLDKSVTDVAGGYTHACALHSGALKCWGNTRSGQIGAGGPTSQDYPAPKTIIATGATKAVAGRFEYTSHTCAIVGGAAKCWGENSSYQLGLGNTNVDRNTPQQVIGLTSAVSDVAAGGSHSCAVHSGVLKCWGRNSSYQLGLNSPAVKTTPATVALSNVSQLSLGRYASCAINTAGALYCWGSDGWAENGGKGTARVPTLITGLTSGVKSVAAADGSTCAVHGADVKCWGSNREGQLAAGWESYYTKPEPVSGY